MKRKKIKIKFVDFWKHWNELDNFIINCLKEKYEVELSDNPDYIFFSNFNQKFEHMKYNDCVKIFYTQENLCPDFNYADYAIGFDKLEFGDRYLQYPIYYIPERYQRAWNLMIKKHKNIIPEMSNRKFCSFVVSNRDADKIREIFFDELSKYKKVESGGKYLNNINLPHGVNDKITFESEHKFSICFENSSHPGYTTEKIIEAFAAQTIPIYWGDPNIETKFNKNAFINIHSFSSIKDAIQKIIELDQDDEKYIEYLKQPALKEKDNYEDKQQELKQFLFSIFDQPLEKAQRRNMLFWGKEYHRRYNNMRKSYNILYLFFYISHMIERLIIRVGGRK